MIRVNTIRMRGMSQRFKQAKQYFPDIVKQAILEGEQKVAQNLSDAAPKGKSGSDVPIPGDAAGPLSQSFQVEPTSSKNLGFKVLTTQPTKLKFVTGGTGIYGPTGQRITPKVKKALFWPGATHPVRSVRGQRANDFVTPVLSAANQLIEDGVSEAVHTFIEETLHG